jgi:hypothetical protein
MIKLTVSLVHGHQYSATFVSDDVAAQFVSRKRNQVNVAFVAETAAIDPEVAPVPETWTKTLDVLYPTCHHGLSAELCMDPYGDNHWGTIEQELAGLL